MSGLRLSILWIQWIVFRRPSVILIDFDGEMHARLAHGIRNKRFAKRMSMGVSSVRLLPHGNLTGSCYVEEWVPLYPEEFSIT